MSTQTQSADADRDTGAMGIPKPMAADAPTTKANLVAQFVESLYERDRMLSALDAFRSDVGRYLQERGLAKDFAAWRKTNGGGRP